MSTKKILKFYLITTLSLSSLAVFSLNDGFREYLSYGYASVITDSKPNPVGAQSKIINQDNPARMIFSIIHDGANSLVGAGEENVDFMNLVFAMGATKAKLKNLTFTIKGVDGNNIKNAYLAHEKDVLATGRIADNKIKFTNIDFELKPNTKITLPVRLDLGENLQAGNIITLDIEKADDVSLEVNGRNYGLNGRYPIKGGYLSIVKFR
ncbi:hypothetical protein HZA40_01045 [Candidatus Peregrinibacteria bacterium]|nr:hypothetical protein [Candidatus Peregrinibacteria bacterium]